MKKMIVQIYEVTSSIEAKKLTKLGVDYIGVLVGKGKYRREINYKRAKRIFKSLPKGKKGVALSLSSDLKEIIQLVKEINPDILHLGALSQSLTPKDVEKLKKYFPKLKIMRAIPVLDERSLKLAKQYAKVADYLLLDSYEKGDFQIGAVGKTHNWNISRRIVKSVKIPVILAGGLGPENVAEAIKKVRPAGVDSKTKTDKIGSHKKDIDKVKKFVKIAKSFK